MRRSQTLVRHNDCFGSSPGKCCLRLYSFGVADGEVGDGEVGVPEDWRGGSRRLWN